ncbi:hypothetical protein RRG08_018432 [Elysia crispata]|uniref:Uncharacterized protein n=1 Tax=Elysia crispata TaxID=231223 RepID=A0AAE1BBA6_9GAST|nr:hypothetical protein RRG08_018432 [Elysia crispata]
MDTSPPTSTGTFVLSHSQFLSTEQSCLDPGDCDSKGVSKFQPLLPEFKVTLWLGQKDLTFGKKPTYLFSIILAEGLTVSMFPLTSCL